MDNYQYSSFMADPYAPDVNYLVTPQANAPDPGTGSTSGASAPMTDNYQELIANWMQAPFCPFIYTRRDLNPGRPYQF
jgi:hypothetical protein